MAELENFISVLEAAKILRVHPETVRRLCRQGDLPPQRFGNTWFIDRDKLWAFSETYQPKRGGRGSYYKKWKL
ncbi:helix-turn-helix domain-containing protein [Dehalococcoidales bacterium]|nr:helix-turn-helix domain-containing protein [Dehalococcoidales bacterium]